MTFYLSMGKFPKIIYKVFKPFTNTKYYKAAVLNSYDLFYVIRLNWTFRYWLISLYRFQHIINILDFFSVI